METEVRKSGMLTASKVLGIIQAVSLGVCAVFMLLGTLGSAFAMIGLEMFLGLSIYFIVATIITIIATVYASKANTYQCREYCSIAGGLFIVTAVITGSLTAILCSVFCMVERKKLIKEGTISVKGKVVTWSIIGGISFILMIVGFCVSMFSSLNKLEDTGNTVPYKDVSDYSLPSSSYDDEDTADISEQDEKTDDNISVDYKNALRAAQNYSDLMHMSKGDIYDQLTSEYADNFPADAAQYAVDNVDADFKENALASAKNYIETLGFSIQETRELLSSEYGGQFTEEEVEYAMSHFE